MTDVFNFLITFLTDVFAFGTLPFYCLFVICMTGIVFIVQKLIYMNY